MSLLFLQKAPKFHLPIFRILPQVKNKRLCQITISIASIDLTISLKDQTMNLQKRSKAVSDNPGSNNFNPPLFGLFMVVGGAENTLQWS